MKDKNYYRTSSNIAKSLAHSTRLLIVDALAKKEMCVSEITSIVGADQTTISKHLAILRNAGILSDRKEGLNVIYSLKDRCVLKFFECADNVIKQSARSLACALLALALLFTNQIAGAEDKTAALSLKDIVNIAILNNKPIQIQEEEIEVAKANILNARSAFMPKLNGAGSYTHNDFVPNLSGLTASAKDLGIFGGYKNDNMLNFTADQPIYTGGANMANLRQAQLELKVQQETLRARRLDVEFDAKRLYYGLLLAYETERITRNLFTQAEAHYEDVLSKFNQGTVSKFDVLQSKVQVSKVMPQLVRARNDISLLKADLRKLLYLRMNDPIRIKGQLDCSFIRIKEKKFLSEAYIGRPEMILKLLGIDINKWAIQYAKSTYYPQIDATGTYLFRSNDVGDMFNSRHDNWSVGVVAKMDIFDGFSTKAKVDSAKAKYTQAILSKEDVSEQTAVDIRRGCLDMMQAKAIIDYEKDSIEEAAEALKIANIAYDNGVGTNLDVLDAQVSLSQVERDLVSGIYDYLMAKAFLDRTMGKEYIKETANEKKR